MLVSRGTRVSGIRWTVEVELFEVLERIDGQLVEFASRSSDPMTPGPVGESNLRASATSHGARPMRARNPRPCPSWWQDAEGRCWNACGLTAAESELQHVFSSVRRSTLNEDDTEHDVVGRLG